MECNFYCEGVDKAPQRSLFNALGMTKEEMERPLVGIVSSYNEIVPGHMNIDKIGEMLMMLNGKKRCGVIRLIVQNKI